MLPAESPVRKPPIHPELLHSGFVCSCCRRSSTWPKQTGATWWWSYLLMGTWWGWH